MFVSVTELCKYKLILQCLMLLTGDPFVIVKIIFLLSI